MINWRVRGDYVYPKEYIKFLVHFNGDRDYFECHEILEEYWKASTNMKKDSIWVGFILLAVSRYHHRRRNFNGAKRTLEKAASILLLHEKEVGILGLDIQVLFPQISKLFDEINKERDYQSINLPVTNPILLEACIQECNVRGFLWGKDSNLDNESLVHKHKLRDRTSVIEERMEALKNKKGNE